MPKATSDVMMLFYLHNLGISEIAESLGMSTSAVKTALCRARKNLRKELEARGYLDV